MKCNEIRCDNVAILVMFCCDFAAASVSNLAFTRSSEMIAGIPVRDHEGEVQLFLF